MQKNLKKYNDPGHGWLAVKRADLSLLGIADKVSQFSYERGKTVYLEEDCDMSLYLSAAEAKGWQVTYEIVHHDKRGMGDSPIRSYDHYRAASYTEEERDGVKIDAYDAAALNEKN